MKKIIPLLALIILSSCGTRKTESGAPIITVSIAPFKYFVEAIGGTDFMVNVMVPAGANPHIYEPFPDQINRLRSSVAYISDGYLGFEMTWLDRFYEMNRNMVKMSPSDKIDLIESEHKHEGGNVEGADPHYWVSPKCALIIAGSVRDMLCGLKPENKEKYDSAFTVVSLKIKQLDSLASSLLSAYSGDSFMIYHPNLAYIARDYGLKEIAVEFEGKEPPPSRLKELIDTASERHLKTIFVQREYDSKNANEIASEIGAKVRIIDPLSGNWPEATGNIINSLSESLKESHKH